MAGGGRVFLALGGEEEWHTKRAASSRAGDPARAQALFEVVHSPTVMVRDSPSLNATAVGFCSHGEKVTATGRCGEWLRLAGSTFGGRPLPACVRDVWMMWEHPKFGRLVRQLSGGRLPSINLALGPGCGAEAEPPAGERGAAECDHEFCYRVVCFSATMRTRPDLHGDMVGCLPEGTVVHTDKKKGGWVQVLADGDAFGSWVQVRHPYAGLQLLLVADGDA